MSIGQRLTAAVVLAIAGMMIFCSRGHAGVFNITGTYTNGTTVPADKITIEYHYVHATAGATNGTSTPTNYPITLDCPVRTTAPINISVRFIFTHEDTLESFTVVLHGNKPTTTPVNVVFQLPPPPAPPVPTMRAHSLTSHACPLFIPSPCCVLHQPTFCYPAAVTYSIPCTVSYYTISPCQPVQWAGCPGYSFWY